MGDFARLNVTAVRRTAVNAVTNGGQTVNDAARVRYPETPELLSAAEQHSLDLAVWAGTGGEIICNLLAKFKAGRSPDVWDRLDIDHVIRAWDEIKRRAEP